MTILRDPHYLTAFEVRPGKSQVVHDIVLFSDNIAAGALPDRTRIYVELAASVSKPASMTTVLGLPLFLPPGREYAEGSGSLTVPADVSAAPSWALYPHMHPLGKTMKVALNSANTSPWVSSDWLGRAGPLARGLVRGLVRGLMS